MKEAFEPIFKEETKKDEFFNQISNNTVLILYFNEINCNSCVESYIKEIETYRDSIGAKNIIYLSKYTYDRDMQIFKRINGIKSEIFNISNLNLFDQDEDVPMVFVLDKDMTVNAVFFPMKEDLRGMKYYLQIIRRKYFI